MKIRIINLKRNLPYDYKIEFVEYSLRETELVKSWLTENNIKATLLPSSVYLGEQDAVLFALKWG
jgi:hypothetical protein